MTAFAQASELLVEAESFTTKGGWKVDQQFVHEMGSPYLLAHGIGKPVADAETTAAFPSTGKYHVWVRTKNWVPGKWKAPGRFNVAVAGKILKPVFGTEPEWNWQKGGTVNINSKQVKITLKDLTGFDGRCDAVFFTTNASFNPPNTIKTMKSWRDRLAGLPKTPKTAGKFDVVIVGGGTAGCGAALAAESQGLKVALIHDRPVLGGNASSEVRVHTLGTHGKGGKILKGIDTGHWPNGSEQSVSDTDKRQKTMNAAKGIQQFLGWRAYNANTSGNRISSVDAKHIESGETARFQAPIFIDSTGDGWIGYWAGAEFRYGRENKNEFNEGWKKYGALWSPEKPDSKIMGTSVLWNSHKLATKTTFPEVPWALDVAKNLAAINGEWYWEYSDENKHQIHNAEAIRDHILRAIYGSFYNAKKQPKFASTELKWVAYIAGKRESRRLIGDHIYTLPDAVNNTYFPDTVVEEIREVDVHYQKKDVAKNPSKYDFLSTALFKHTGKYYIPYRSLYSRNIANLMMAGRCFSCSHIGLGGPRVMNTTGQMGIATGYAAALCKKYKMTPRQIGQKKIKELRSLIGYKDAPEK